MSFFQFFLYLLIWVKNYFSNNYPEELWEIMDGNCFVVPVANINLRPSSTERREDPLVETVDVKYTPYEPSNKLWSSTPEPTEFVACIDVLEHIEPELLDNVLNDLQRVVMKFGLFTIHTGPAAKTLPDGRNAHLIQEPLSWWEDKIKLRFKIIKQVAMTNGCIFFVKKG